MKKKVILKVFFLKMVCLSVCLNSFESADARNLGVKTLFILVTVIFLYVLGLMFVDAFVCQ